MPGADRPPLWRLLLPSDSLPQHATDCGEGQQEETNSGREIRRCGLGTEASIFTLHPDCSLGRAYRRGCNFLSGVAARGWAACGLRALGGAGGRRPIAAVISPRWGPGGLAAAAPLREAEGDHV